MLWYVATPVIMEPHVLQPGHVDWLTDIGDSS